MKSRFLQEARAPEEFKGSLDDLASTDEKVLRKRVKQFADLASIATDLKEKLDDASSAASEIKDRSREVSAEIENMRVGNFGSGKNLKDAKSRVEQELRKAGGQVGALKGLMSNIDNLSTAFYHQIEELVK
jgi:predicted nuclease with TOPRIM domain